MKFSNKLSTGVTLFCLLVLTHFCLPAFAQNTSITQAGFYRMNVGDFEVTALSDGTIPQNLPKLLTNVKPGEINRLLEFNFLESTVETSVNTYLIKSNNNLILVDAGTAELFGPTLGQLQQSLQNAGYKPEQINAILITHIHPDHTGGLMSKGAMSFPNATIYISKPEIDFWFGAGNKKKGGEALAGYYKYAEENVGPYLQAGKVKTFELGKPVLEGITSISSPGHTPGHSFFALESKGEKMVFWGDIMHAAAIQLSDPSVTIVYDVDATAAANSRKKAFADAIKHNYWVASDHVTFPGIGHLRSDNGKYIWIPANYTTYKTVSK